MGVSDAGAVSSPAYRSPARGKGRKWQIVEAVAGVVVIGLLVAVYVLHAPGGSSNATTSTTMFPKGASYRIPGGQFDALAFTVHAESVINGTLVSDTPGLWIYLMTPAQVVGLARTGVVSGYNWTSGAVNPFAIYDLNVNFEAGAWDFVLYFGSLGNTTLVVFWTAVTLSPA